MSKPDFFTAFRRSRDFGLQSFEKNIRQSQLRISGWSFGIS